MKDREKKKDMERKGKEMRIGKKDQGEKKIIAKYKQNGKVEDAHGRGWDDDSGKTACRVQ